MGNFQKKLHITQGSAILIGVILMLMIALLSISFIEKILRFSHEGVGIQSSVQAYYKATGAIEIVLMDHKDLKNKPWTLEENIESIKEKNKEALKDVHFRPIYTKSNTIPEEGKGNSPFLSGANYNIISLYQPIQMVISNDINWNNVKFDFRVPKVSEKENYPAMFSQTGIILWTFGHSGGILYAQNNQQIFQDRAVLAANTQTIYDKYGFFFETDGIPQKSSFNDFYEKEKSNCVDYRCTLKLSMIQPVRPSGPEGPQITALEYKISFDEKIPNQYITVAAQGVVRGYVRERVATLPQITSNTVLDFAIFQ